VGAGVAVERELLERPRDRRVGRDARRAECLELRRRHAHLTVQNSGLEILHHRVRVLVGLDEELVDLGLAAPEARVRDQPHVTVVLVLDHLEWTAADERSLVGVGSAGELARDLRPDVLGQDRHLHREDVGLGLAALEHGRGVVGGGHLRHEGEVGREVREVVLDDVVDSVGSNPVRNW
jgi:hypothetical protein